MYEVVVFSSLAVDIIGGAERPGGPPYFMNMAFDILGISAYFIGVIPNKFVWGVPKGKYLVSKGPVFEHTYRGDKRFSRIIEAPDRYHIDTRDISLASRAQIVLVSPIFQEFSIGDIEQLLVNLGRRTIVDVSGLIRYSTNDTIKHSWTKKIRRLLKETLIYHVSTEETTIDQLRITEGTALITGGSMGAMLLERTKNEALYVPAYKVDGDPTGAGDFFLAAFISNILVGAPILDALSMAASLTSLKIEGKITSKFKVTLGDIISEALSRAEWIKENSIFLRGHAIWNFLRQFWSGEV